MQIIFSRWYFLCASGTWDFAPSLLDWLSLTQVFFFFYSYFGMNLNLFLLAHTTFFYTHKCKASFKKKK